MIKTLPDSVKKALQRSAELHQCTVDEILSRSRQVPLSAARASAAKQLRANGCSLHTIGRYLGVDHTSVVYYCRQGAVALPPAEPEPSYDPNAPDESGIWI